MHHRAVVAGWLPPVPASDKMWHRAVSEASEKDVVYLARQTTSLTQGVVGREPSLAHGNPLCSHWRGSWAPSTLAAPCVASSSATASFHNLNNASTSTLLAPVSCSCRTRVTPTSASSFAGRVPCCRKAGLTASVGVDTPLQYRGILQDGARPNTECASTMSWSRQLTFSKPISDGMLSWSCAPPNMMISVKVSSSRWVLDTIPTSHEAIHQTSACASGDA